MSPSNTITVQVGERVTMGHPISKESNLLPIFHDGRSEVNADFLRSQV